MLPDATDLIPVLAVSTAARRVFCFARVADDNPRAGILHEAFLDFLSRRPADTLAEVVIGDGACPGGESIMVIDVDVSAETDELGERSARFAFFDDRVERRARVVHLGNVPVRVDVRTVDVLSVAVPRRTLLVDVSDEVGAPEHERGQVIARMVVDLNCENAVVGDATGGYGDELADGEHAKQWAVVVGFALEAAQLFDGGTRVVLDLVEGGGVHDFLPLTGGGFVDGCHCITVSP